MSAKLIKAYILGFGKSIECEERGLHDKHFSGRPHKEGLDPHFEFQRIGLSSKNFKYHLIPFESAFAVHTPAIMPYYGVP
jgi:beta-glucosidase